MGLFIRIKEKFRNYIREITAHHRSPHDVALGFAVGTLISILPTPGLNIIIGSIVAAVYPKINSLSLFGAIFFWNAFTLIPVYAASYFLGDLIFGNQPTVHYDVTWMNRFYSYSKRFLVGNVMVAVGTSLVSYFVVKWSTLIYYRKKYGGNYPRMAIPEDIKREVFETAKPAEDQQTEPSL